MKIRIDHHLTIAAASSLFLSLSACNGELAVVDDLDTTGAGLSSYRSGGPPLNASCACASSDSLMALSCGGGVVPLVNNDVVQTTSDGNIVAFNLCEREALSGLGECHVVYWDGGFAELPIASGLLLGLSESGAHVLTSGADAANPGAPQLIGLNGTSTIPLDVIMGQGALSAAGDTVIGAMHLDDGTSQLARANTSTGEVEVLGMLNHDISRIYVNPDASAIVGFSSISDPGSYEAYRYTEQGLTFGIPGAPTGIRLFPEAVSHDGAVVAGRAGATHFRWTEAEGYVEVASASDRSETSLSADGSVLLGSLDPDGVNDSSAFRWTQATGAVEIAPGVGTLALDMSDDGGVVVALSWEEAQLEGASPEHTFVWNATDGTRTLEEVLRARGADMTGWNFGHARALSGNGKVLLGRAICGGVPTLYRVVLSD